MIERDKIQVRCKGGPLDGKRVTSIKDASSCAFLTLDRLYRYRVDKDDPHLFIYLGVDKRGNKSN